MPYPFIKIIEALLTNNSFYQLNKENNKII